MSLCWDELYLLANSHGQEHDGQQCPSTGGQVRSRVGRTGVFQLKENGGNCWDGTFKNQPHIPLIIVGILLGISNFLFQHEKLLNLAELFSESFVRCDF